jgi:hypothetical protein
MTGVARPNDRLIAVRGCAKLQNRFVRGPAAARFDDFGLQLQ